MCKCVSVGEVGVSFLVFTMIPVFLVFLVMTMCKCVSVGEVGVSFLVFTMIPVFLLDF